MRDVETRLNKAAEETRLAARQTTPPPLISAKPGRAQGWLVLAAAFATVLVVFALIPLLAGPEPGEVGVLPAPTTSGAEPTTTVTEVEGTFSGECSATGVAQPELDPDLPDAVAAKAHAIVRFASMCSIDGLAGIATGEFTTSFGGGGVENLGRWEDERRGQLGTLLELFDTSHAVLESEEGPDIYVWPAAFAYDTWEDIPAGHREELLALYTEEELDQIAGFGSYAGWRTGIDEQGNWLFFVAGD